MTSGARVGTNFMLDPAERNRVGRGTDCNIILVDPLCSRVHAELFFGEEGWWMQDSGSRNGTYVNGQKIDEARLTDGCSIRMGSTEFTFHTSGHPPTRSSVRDTQVMQTILQEYSVQADSHDSTGPHPPAANPDTLPVLHELTVQLLGCSSDPDQVVRTTLDRLREQTAASVAGFLWVSDEGQLKPKLVVPDDKGSDVALSQQLTEIVCEQARAVWIANQSSTGSRSSSLRHFADALCIPLIHEEKTLGAIHLYRDQRRFSQEHFYFAISVANVLVLALVRAREQASLRAEHDRLVASSAGSDELLGDSPPMQQLKSKIARIARATGCVLVRGESGSGKELVARALHKCSNRSDRPMLSVNCAAIPAELIESQLFGHKKGAFTSADSDHIGWFEQADSGTLFLDEVGELPLAGQAKLLRILEGHPFLPVGGVAEISVDTRVIAATNRELREFVQHGKFREDLYYRLSVFELELPPLRDRGSDIELLVDHFLHHFSGNHGRPDLQLTGDARAKLLSYSWPGNVRQLRNVIDSAVVMAEGDSIGTEDLGLRHAASDQIDSLRIDDWEQKLIRDALKRTSGKVPDAAKLLGIGRATLYRKLEEYNIAR